VVVSIGVLAGCEAKESTAKIQEQLALGVSFDAGLNQDVKLDCPGEMTAARPPKATAQGASRYLEALATRAENGASAAETFPMTDPPVSANSRLWPVDDHLRSAVHRLGGIPSDVCFAYVLAGAATRVANKTVADRIQRHRRPGGRGNRHREQPDRTCCRGEMLCGAAQSSWSGRTMHGAAQGNSSRTRSGLLNAHSSSVLTALPMTYELPDPDNEVVVLRSGLRANRRSCGHRDRSARGRKCEKSVARNDATVHG
jgi:hypothetical protein